MSRSVSKTPLINRDRIACSSPAREALEANLDGHLTLNKKKSWFGSLRDAVQKGALHAKAAVDSFRGDQKMAKIENEAESEAESCSTSSSMEGAVSSMMAQAGLEQGHALATDIYPRVQPNSSVRDSVISLNSLPLTRKRLNGGPEVSTVGSADATQSSRSDPRQDAAKHHRKRSSVLSTGERSKSRLSHIRGPETFESPQHKDEASAGHKRHTSIASSLAGSIRGLRRRTPKIQPAVTQKAVSPDKPAENVPLPSSPINIPTAAPFVELDLGPAGFMSSTFVLPMEKERKREDLKFTDLANITTGRPDSYRLAVSNESEARSASSARGATPSDLLNLPRRSTDQSDDALPLGPATPMPGTNLILELDGANSDKSDKSQFFERSVTPALTNESKELRTMRSLDAMAQAATALDAYDGTQETFQTAKKNHQSPDGSPRSTALVEVAFYTPRRDTLSEATLNSCPSDMEELSRQKVTSPVAGGNSRQEVTVNDNTGYDPFITSEASGVGPPSPTRSIKLPFRPKSVEGECRTMPAAVAAQSSQQRTGKISEVSEVITLSPSFNPNQSLETQMLLGHDDTFTKDSPDLEGSNKSATSPQNAEIMEKLASDGDTETRAQGLLTSDVVSANHYNTESPMRDGLSPHGSPLVPKLYQNIQPKQRPTSGSARSRTTYTAGLGDAEYRFKFSNWLQSTSTAYGPDEQPRTPQRRSMDVSIDSVSTNDERQTPQISPASSSAENTPSMGNKVEFDLKRSQRNMRYIALHEESLFDDLADSPTVEEPPLSLIMGSSVEIDANAFRFADFEHAYASSRAGSPKKDATPMRSLADGDDSMGAAPEEATNDHTSCEQSLNQAERNSDMSFHPQATNSRPHTSELWDKLMIDAGLENEPASGRDRASLESSTKESTTDATKASIVDSSEIVPDSPTTTQIESVSPTPYSGTNQGSSTSVEASLSPRDQISESNTDSILPHNTAHARERVTSSDTLDNSIYLFSSPDSGCGAEKGSVSPPTKSKGPPASRYRSLRKRPSTMKPSDKLSGNIM